MLPESWVQQLFCWCIHWTWALHFDWLCFFVKVSICWKEKFSWWGVRTIPNCVCKDAYLECSQGLYWFGEVVVVGSPLNSMTALGLGFPVPSVSLLLLRRSEVQLESGWSPPRCVCHCSVVLVIVETPNIAVKVSTCTWHCELLLKLRQSPWGQ